MNKFILLAALVACAYGVPLPEAEGEREGRDVFVVQQFPAAPFIPQAAPAEQDPLFFTKPTGVSVGFPTFNISSLFPSSNSNGGYFIARDPAPAPYPYPYYVYPAQPNPLFRRAPYAQPLYLVPVEQAQAAPFPSEANADAVAAAAAEQQIQGRFFGVQLPADLSSVNVNKPTLFSLGNTGSSGILTGLNGLSGVGTSASFAILNGAKGVSVDGNGNLFLSP